MDIKQTIIETHQGDIKIVQYNKPNKKNAIDGEMYKRVIRILNDAATDDNISVMVLTGTGDFYSSGNDFSSARDASSNNHLTILKDYINAFIMFPKLLVAIVNGPAIGIAATTLALCDLVFASENSYFYTPFSKLGIVAEGCSTFTFPRILGERKALEMLLCNYRMPAKEALAPNYCVTATKKLFRDAVRGELLKANENEMDELNAIWLRNVNKSKI